ncbi:MAG: PTS glucose transporter subunit IIA [Hydrogenibacillus schlegelii]|uniref:PTS glucose transporter subunit IIA n=1 Tax=Hydrogenibacillus schlegelii TaxID=1484 RepID=A0A2T5GD70_HYDSH|nr:PTS glucose transporter subunit IIA [Hydrogenibacillus schlegelii]MBT9281083.1 PTS glucose transporter subunit IIA [Hydrogenibacillus schlegelii]PTQ54098.1 MAG: PTS system, glucose-specific IIC component [Hydrogenibacillus schlegelii]
MTFLQKLFKSRNIIDIVAPMNGRSVDITEVPDPTFSEKMIGDGVAIDPSDGTVVAPVTGEVVQVFPTGHAVGLRTPSGLELLVHIGLETVGLKGEGFTLHVEKGAQVEVGAPLLTFDLTLVRERAKAISPIVITNMERVLTLEKLPFGDVQVGRSPLMKVEISRN